MICHFVALTQLSLMVSVLLCFYINKAKGISSEPELLLKKKCGFTSCQSARHESPNAMDFDTFRTARCYCDPDCEKYHDCCYDVVSNKSLFLSDSITPRWNCTHIPSERTDFYMVTSCPPHHTQLSKLCTRVESEGKPYDYKQDIPVLSSKSGTWYQNFYCALCHEEQYNLVPVTLYFKCTRNLTSDEVLQNGVYQPHSLSWKLANDTCELKFGANVSNETTGDRTMRRCLPHESYCASDWKNETVQNLCNSYTYFVYGRINGKRKAYKNPHCALCNHVKMKSLHCWSDDGGTTRVAPELSLITLLNIHWTIGATNCHPPTHIYDPLHEKCQLIEYFCPADAFFKNGECVRNHSNDSNFTMGEPELERSCPVISLNKNEYTILNNSIQLALKTSHQLIPEDQYQITENGEAKVCFSAISSFPHVQDSIVSVICLSLSVICLTLHNLIYCLLPKLRNLPAKNLFSMSTSLLLAQFIFLTGLSPVIDVPKPVCVAIAILIQYFFLSSFFWMNVLSYDVWRTFGVKKLTFGPRGSHWKYAIYAWGVPALTVCLSLLFEYLNILPIEFRPNYAQLMTCWFGSQEGLLIFFVTPMFAVIIMNVGFFSNTVYKLNKSDESDSFSKNSSVRESLKSGQKGLINASEKRQSNKTDQLSHVTGKRDKIQFYLFLKLFVIMGLTWLSGIIAIIFDVEILRYTFVIFNGLQGVFIFLMFDFKCKVGGMLLTKIFCCCLKQSGTPNRRESSGNYRSIPHSSGTMSSCL